MKTWKPTPEFGVVLNAAAAEPGGMVTEPKDLLMERYLRLVRGLAESQPNVAATAIKVMQGYGMRTSPLYAAVEFGMSVSRGDKRAREVVDHACTEPWQPTRLLNYQLQRYGRQLPRYVKTGLSRAVRRLYDERAALWYDPSILPVRMGDLIRLCHPMPRGRHQSALFRYLMRGADPRVDLSQLPMIKRYIELMKYPQPARAQIPVEMLQEAGMRWTTAMQWLHPAESELAWSKAVPLMDLRDILNHVGLMNSDRVTEATMAEVCYRLSDPAEVATAKLSPLDVWTAFKACTRPELIGALRQTLNYVEVPPFQGLILIDTGPHMNQPVSRQTHVTMLEVALLHAVLSMKASNKADVYLHDSHVLKIELRNGFDIVGAMHGLMNLALGPGVWDNMVMVRHFDETKHRGVMTFSSSHADRLAVPPGMTVPLVNFRFQQGKDAVVLNPSWVNINSVHQRLLDVANKMHLF